MVRVFKRCAQARGNSNSSGFSTIKIPVDPKTHPKDCTEWKTLDCPEEIEQALLTRNRSHFGQSQGTPFTVPPLSHQINFEASTETAELILNGTYSNEELDEITKMLLEHMKKVSEPVVTSNITAAKFRSKILLWKERTSTSPSGIHLEHYKAYYATHAHEKDTAEYEEFEQKRQDIMDSHLSLLNYAIDHGHSFDRWKKIVTMMIEKEPGNHKIHRLRVIHLYEADYNLLLCVKWRTAVDHAMRNKTLNPNQKGGTPGSNATDVIYVEELEYEICRASRTCLGKIDFDASSCYNRITASWPISPAGNTESTRTSA